MRNQIAPFAREHVDDSAWQIARRENLRKCDRWERMLFRCQDDGCVAAQYHWRDERYQRKQNRLVRRDDDYDTARFRRGKIEMRSGDGIHRAKDLRILIGPARVIN